MIKMTDPEPGSLAETLIQDPSFVDAVKWLKNLPAKQKDYHMRLVMIAMLCGKVAE